MIGCDSPPPIACAVPSSPLLRAAPRPEGQEHVHRMPFPQRLMPLPVVTVSPRASWASWRQPDCLSTTTSRQAGVPQTPPSILSILWGHLHPWRHGTQPEPCLCCRYCHEPSFHPADPAAAKSIPSLHSTLPPLPPSTHFCVHLPCLGLVGPACERQQCKRGIWVAFSYSVKEKDISAI